MTQYPPTGDPDERSGDQSRYDGPPDQRHGSGQAGETQAFDPPAGYGTQPYGQPGDYGTQPYGQPGPYDTQPQGQWGQGQPEPQYGSPQYGAQQYGAPQYGAPQYGAPQYGQYGQQQYGQYGGGGYPGQLGQNEFLANRGAPGKPKRTRLLVTSVAAVVVVAAGGVATYAAVSDAGGSGASSPKAAIQNAVKDLNNSDLVGFLDDLAPGERRALAKPIAEVISQLKRNDVLDKNADPTKIGGLQISATNFTYSPNTITVNDHVQIVQLTGGLLTVSGDASKVPLSKDFLDAVVPGGLTGKKTQHVNIADELKKDGMPAARLAAQKVDGSWYPSLFYTIADNATYTRGLPSPSDAIPATGASSADGVVSDLVDDALMGDVDGIVGLLSPDELGVVHDYGRKIIPSSHFRAPFGDIKLSGLTFDSKSIGDGAQLLSLKTATITTNGRSMSLSRDGDCVSVKAANGQSRRTCPGTSGANSIGSLIKDLTGRPLTTRQLSAINDLFSGASDGGVVVSQTNGKWFLNPVRTITTVAGTLLSGLQSGDLLALISIVKN